MFKDVSLQSVWTLFKLDLRSRFGTTRRRGVKYRLTQALNVAFYLAVYAALIIAIYYLTRVFVERSQLRLEFLVLASMLTILLATAIATGSVIKNLYQNADNELLLRFPVSGTEILFAKSIYIFLQNILVCLLVMMPIYIAFGVVTKAAVGDYFAYIGVVLLASLVPFFVANIIAVPVMKLLNAVKNKYVLVLVATIAVVLGIFILYLVSLGNVLTYMRDEQESIFSAQMVLRYRRFAAGAYPFRWYGELINGRKYGSLSAGGLALRFLYIFLMTAALGVGAYFVTARAYYKTILYGIQAQKATVSRKVKDKQSPTIVALISKEFYLILRSFNYSFEFLAMAFAAPVMIFFCNRLAATMGTENIMTFSSTSISREGNCMYLTKVIPVSYKTQVLAKYALYATVASISVAVSCLVSGIYYTTNAGGHMLTAVDVAAIWGITELLALSMTALSMIVDVKWPTFNVSGDGELVAANKNMALALVLGIVIAVIFGVALMIFNFFPIHIGGGTLASPGKLGNIYLILAILSLALFGGSMFGLLHNLDKNYANIVP